MCYSGLCLWESYWGDCTATDEEMHLHHAKTEEEIEKAQEEATKSDKKLLEEDKEHEVCPKSGDEEW